MAESIFGIVINSAKLVYNMYCELDVNREELSSLALRVNLLVSMLETYPSHRLEEKAPVVTELSNVLIRAESLAAEFSEASLAGKFVWGRAWKQRTDDINTDLSRWMSMMSLASDQRLLVEVGDIQKLLQERREADCDVSTQLRLLRQAVLEARREEHSRLKTTASLKKLHRTLVAASQNDNGPKLSRPGAPTHQPRNIVVRATRVITPTPAVGSDDDPKQRSPNSANRASLRSSRGIDTTLDERPSGSHRTLVEADKAGAATDPVLKDADGTSRESGHDEKTAVLVEDNNEDDEEETVISKYQDLPPSLSHIFMEKGSEYGSLLLSEEHLTFNPEPAYEGGFGQVHIGTYVGQPIVLKKLLCLKPSSASIREMLNEALIMKRYNFEFFATVYGVCVVDGIPGIVMKRMDTDLFKFLHDRRKASVVGDAVWKLQKAIFICKGVEVLHRVGILHRDLKTPNILVNGKFGESVCITDFGMALLRKETSTKRQTEAKYLGKHEPVGSYPWMAPEIMLAGKSTRNQQMFSLWE